MHVLRDLVCTFNKTLKKNKKNWSYFCIFYKEKKKSEIL